MSATERLEEIKARAEAANDGPWEADGQDFWTPSGRSDFHLSPADVKFIVAARTDVPRLVAALQAVLDQHKPMRMYEHEDTCEDESEEHREERHVESTESNGEYYCLDLPTGITLCAECSRDLDFDGRDYPCPTVRAVEAALGEDDPIMEAIGRAKSADELADLYEEHAEHWTTEHTVAGQELLDSLQA